MFVTPIRKSVLLVPICTPIIAQKGVFKYFILEVNTILILKPLSKLVHSLDRLVNLEVRSIAKLSWSVIDRLAVGRWYYDKSPAVYRMTRLLKHENFHLFWTADANSIYLVAFFISNQITKFSPICVTLIWKFSILVENKHH